jgi:hypothetical protein
LRLRFLFRAGGRGSFAEGERTVAQRNEMAQRGAQSDRMDALQAVMARNEIRFEIKAIDREVRELEASAGRDESRVMDNAAGAVGAVAEGVARVADAGSLNHRPSSNG